VAVQERRVVPAPLTDELLPGAHGLGLPPATAKTRGSSDWRGRSNSKPCRCCPAHSRCSWRRNSGL
jgi:hypothetical protein